MNPIPLKLPFGRVFNRGGAAGPRRLLMIGGTTIVVVSAVAAVAMHNNVTPMPTELAKTPAADPLPGGPHSNPVYTDLARRADQDKAAKAALAGQSSVAVMPGSETAKPVPPPVVAVVTPQPAQPEAGVGRPEPTPVVATPYRPQLQVVSNPVAPPISLQARQADDKQAAAYQAAIGSLDAGWGGKPQATEVILPPEEKASTIGGGPSSQYDARPSSISGGRATQTPIPNARPLAGTVESGTVLMPAGRGVYARTVLAASSDQGGPVLLEALSGPIAGDRMTGTFTQRDNRLVVHLDSITLQDGRQAKIDALVTAPDTMETSVASSVDQHILTRFLLPVAAAFVSGLGQAIGQSNSTVVAGPLGGATAFQKLNLSQELGVAAGAGANQFGAAVQQAPPRGPTVNLDANVNVGVVFLSPLVVGGDR